MEPKILAGSITSLSGQSLFIKFSHITKYITEIMANPKRIKKLLFKLPSTKQEFFPYLFLRYNSRANIYATNDKTINAAASKTMIKSIDEIKKLFFLPIK